MTSYIAPLPIWGIVICVIAIIEGLIVMIYSWFPRVFDEKKKKKV